MIKVLVALLSLFVAGISNADHAFRTKVYQPLDSLFGDAPEAEEVPYVIASDKIPETVFSRITAPHIPQQDEEGTVGDINLASLAGISIRAEWKTRPENVLIVFDFSKAHEELVTEDLAKALIECVRMTATQLLIGDKPIEPFSLFVGGDRFPAIQKLVESSISTEPFSKEKSEPQDSGRNSSTRPEGEEATQSPSSAFAPPPAGEGHQKEVRREGPSLLSVVSDIGEHITMARILACIVFPCGILCILASVRRSPRYCHHLGGLFCATSIAYSAVWLQYEYGHFSLYRLRSMMGTVDPSIEAEDYSAYYKMRAHYVLIGSSGLFMALISLSVRRFPGQTNVAIGTPGHTNPRAEQAADGKTPDAPQPPR